jgi:hypothetical protein
MIKSLEELVHCAEGCEAAEVVVLDTEKSPYSPAKSLECHFSSLVSVVCIGENSPRGAKSRFLGDLVLAPSSIGTILQH